MQLLANNASALLSSAISAVATTLTVEAARADLFPIGNTTNFATPLDWFKVTLEDVSGNIEIIRVGVRASASAVMSTILRGQDGTVARAYAVGSVVELRVTALDLQPAVAADAALIANTPSGGLVATTVQAAINELNSKKADPGAIQAQSYTAVTTVGTSTAYVVATLPVQPSLVAGQRYRIKLHTPNGLNPTLTRDGLAAAPYKVYNSTGAKIAPPPATLPTLFDAEYDGVDYVVLNPLPSGLTMSTARLLGRTTAGTGTPEEISAGTGLTLAAGSLSRNMTPNFTSANQTVSGGAILNVAHGLAAMPTMKSVVLKCTTAEFGYAAGDEVDLSSGSYISGNQIVQVAWDATNCTINHAGATLQLNRRDTTAQVNITLTSWRWVVRAWL